MKPIGGFWFFRTLGANGLISVSHQFRDANDAIVKILSRIACVVRHASDYYRADTFQAQVGYCYSYCICTIWWL